MSSNAAIRRFRDMRPLRFRLLQRFEMVQGFSASQVAELSITLETGSETTGESLVLRFRGVRDLQIDWPTLSVIHLDVIEIDDVSDRGLEDLRYRVSEGTSMFAFWCLDFTADIEKQEPIR